MSKANKGPITKGSVSAPELKNASEVKKINQAVNAQPIKIAKQPLREELVDISETRKHRRAPNAKPVKKRNLKDKSSELAKKIEYTVERKGAEVKKDNTDKAIRDLGKKFLSTDMTGASSSKAAPKAAPKKRGRPKKAPIKPSS